MGEFFLRAVLGGIGVALVAGPLGSFVVWRRMAFVGDTMSHSALLGVAVGLALHIHVAIGVLVAALAVAFLLGLSQRQRRLPTDAFLGILAHASLAIGLIVMALLDLQGFALMSYLFGDILAVSWADLYWIYGGAALALGLLVVIWRPLLSLTVHEEMARVEGVPVERVRIVFMLLIAIVIAVALEIVGVLLITSMLIIPAAAARRFARTPEQMAVLAALIGMVAVVGGLFGSLAWDTPAGPSIVTAAAALFALAILWPGRSATGGGINASG
jgi:zinc transport system permease protein